jgi:CheY-like chemotaxis protein
LQFQREKIRSELEQFQRSAGGAKAASDGRTVEKAVRRATEPSAANRLAGKTILWVDDHPENNRLGVRALTRLRLHVESAISTDEALLHLERHPEANLIISDMGRGENMRAGYELLEQVRKRGIEVPFVIFAGSDTPEFRKAAADRGAQLSTNNVGELLNFITDTLGG